MTDLSIEREIDFSSFLTKGSKKTSIQAQGLIRWWKIYHQPGFLRKHPECTVVDLSPEILRVEGKIDDDANAINKIRSSMRKIKIEDLGFMQATDLLASIPEDDPDGRGLKDLRSIEKKLSIKVVFDDSKGHVYLVGEIKKLEKKAFALRNLLSHYHWRLSGTDISMST